MATAPMKSVDQVAVVVRDLDEAMRRYSQKLGIAPWSVYTFSPNWIRNMTFRGREQPYSMRLALAQVGDMMYELIEPMEGPNSYLEFLDTRGEGLHPPRLLRRKPRRGHRRDGPPRLPRTAKRPWVRRRR